MNVATATSSAAGGGDEDEVDFDHDSRPIDPQEETTDPTTTTCADDNQQPSSLGMDPWVSTNQHELKRNEGDDDDDISQ